jgi:hypothetical protein
LELNRDEEDEPNCSQQGFESDVETLDEADCIAKDKLISDHLHC